MSYLTSVGAVPYIYNSADETEAITHSNVSSLAPSAPGIARYDETNVARGAPTATS